MKSELSYKITASLSLASSLSLSHFPSLSLSLSLHGAIASMDLAVLVINWLEGLVL